MSHRATANSVKFHRTVLASRCSLSGHISIVLLFHLIILATFLFIKQSSSRKIHPALEVRYFFLTLYKMTKPPQSNWFGHYGVLLSNSKVFWKVPEMIRTSPCSWNSYAFPRIGRPNTCLGLQFQDTAVAQKKIS